MELEEEEEMKINAQLLKSVRGRWDLSYLQLGDTSGQGGSKYLNN